jgi:hypothetical protein
MAEDHRRSDYAVGIGRRRRVPERSVAKIANVQLTSILDYNVA